MPIHYTSRTLPLLLLGSILGCSGRSRDNEPTVGERVLSEVPGPTIAREPEQRFSLPVTGNGPHEFTDLRGVLVAKDGTVAAADAGVPGVFLFNAAGEPIATIGRGGSGPGEFREPTLVAFWGDSLAVFDPPQRRLTYLRHDGSLIRQRTVTVPGTMAFSILGIRNDGALIFKGTVLQAPAAGGSLQRLKAVILEIDTSDRVDTLAVVEDGLWHPNGPLWFAWRSAVAVTDSGFWYGSSGRPDLHFELWDGHEGPTLRWDGHTRAVNDQDRSVIAEIAGARRAAPVLTAADRFADSIPYFARLLPDPAGGVWVVGSSAPFAAPDSAWFVDPAKATIAGVALPRGFRPYQFAADFVLGVQSNDDGGLTVVRFRLMRRSSE